MSESEKKVLQIGGQVGEFLRYESAWNILLEVVREAGTIMADKQLLNS